MKAITTLACRSGDIADRGARGARSRPTGQKPVRFIVGCAGSATGITARMFAEIPGSLERRGDRRERCRAPARQRRPGKREVGSRRDTFYQGASGALTINPTLLTSQTYDVARDLVPVARLLVMASILAVNNDVPAKSRSSSRSPGRSPSRQAIPVRLARRQRRNTSCCSELLKRQAGIDVVHVPYRAARWVTTT